LLVFALRKQHTAAVSKIVGIPLDAAESEAAR